MNRIDRVFETNSRPLLSVYFTAGYPTVESMYTILPALEQGGADIVEIGMPFSDPLADGPTIQKSSQQALKNGMTVQKLFEQLSQISFNIPVILMGYLNPVLQFGLDNFLKRCEETGVSGCIIPDMPLTYFQQHKEKFIRHNIFNILLVTPQTPLERIQKLSEETQGFLYAVSSASTTGNKSFADSNTEYLANVRTVCGLKPVMIGFGIRTAQDFQRTQQYADGAIIGSKFIEILADNNLKNSTNMKEAIHTFVHDMKTLE